MVEPAAPAEEELAIVVLHQEGEALPEELVVAHRAPDLAASRMVRALPVAGDTVPDIADYPDMGSGRPSDIAGSGHLFRRRIKPRK